MVLPRLCSLMSRNALEVAPGAYQLTVRYVNIILIAEEELTIIDTGYLGSSGQIVDYIHSLGRSPEEISLIILTHNHLDHIGGLSELRKLTEAKVAIHKADIADIEGQRHYPRVVKKALRVPPLSTLRSAFSIKSDEVDIQPLSNPDVFRHIVVDLLLSKSLANLVLKGLFS